MKNLLLVLFSITFFTNYAQTTTEAVAIGAAAAITIIAADANKKEIAKQITQFRSKEYIVNDIIGPANKRQIKFETESLASDNSAGLISVAFNCNEVNERGLLLAFFGDNVHEGKFVSAYAFRYIPLAKAQSLLKSLIKIKEGYKNYLSD